MLLFSSFRVIDEVCRMRLSHQDVHQPAALKHMDLLA